MQPLKKMENIYKYCLVAYFDCYAYSPLIEKDAVGMLTKMKMLKKELFDITNIPCMRFFYFSDLAFLLYDVSEYYQDTKIEAEKIQECVKTFIDKLTDCYHIYVEKGLLLTGGITFGEVLVDEDILCGNSITNAVRLQENQVSPIILMPEKVLDELGCKAWQGIIIVPIKNNRFITGLAVIPKKTKEYLEIMKKMHRQECYNGSEYSGKISTLVSTTRQILLQYKRIKRKG